MKKRMYAVFMMLVMALCMTACGKDKEKDEATESVSVQDDIVEFVNVELAAVLTYRDTAIESYNSYFISEDMDTAAFLTELEVAAIPNMESFITELENIQVATSEVQELKDLCIESANKQLEAMKLVVTAIKEENPDYLAQADILISEAGELMTQYESALKLLCIDYDVDISGSF